MDKQSGQVNTGSGLRSIDQSRRKWPKRPLQLDYANFSTSQPAQGHTDHPLNPPTRLLPHSLSTTTVCRAFDSKPNSFLSYTPITNVTPFPISGFAGQIAGPPRRIFPPTPSPLFITLTKSMCRALDPKSRSFLPQDQLKALAPPLVKEELRRAMPTLPESVLDNYTTEIFARHNTDQEHPPPRHMKAPPSWQSDSTRQLIKTFVVLVLLDRVESIPSFIYGGFTDSLLPIDHSLFSNENTSHGLFSPIGRIFDNWTPTGIKLFMEMQWIVLSPFLGNVKGDVSLYNFSAQTVLPIFDNDGITKPATNLGGYSIVRRVKIHSWHHSFQHGQDEPSFALKRLHSPHIKDFRREVIALRRFVISPNLHIIKLLAAFRHGTSFYLLFPWAEGGNLRSFCKENPNPVIHGSFLVWIVEQCLGIATALHQIHHGHYTEVTNAGNSSGPTDISYYGLHGDIKPANILLFEDGLNGENPIWVLSDFGLGGLHHKTETKVGNRPTGFSPTYRAPELDIKGTVDSAYDIWSLGCVFLEIAVWLLRGWDGVESFALSRVSTGELVKKAGWMNDEFFEVLPPQPLGAAKARLKSSVNECFSSNRYFHPRIDDFLDLIHDDLLDVNWETRINGSFLSEKLECLRGKCLEDPVYTIALPRPRKPPWSYQQLASPKDNNSILHCQTQQIQVNMAQIPLQNELDDPGMMQIPQGIFWPGFMQQPHDTMDRVVPLDTMPNNRQQDTFRDESALPLNRKSPNETLFRDLNGRKRTLDDITDSINTGDQRKKKARKKNDSLATGSSSCEQPNITTQDLSQAAAQECLESTNPTGEKRLFACPFHKRNPARYSTKAWKSCIGPGWEISRLKEHIYRRHFLACYRCDRCFGEFQSSSDLHCHSRSDPPCQKRDSDVDFDTIDETQKAQIKKKPRGVSDEQKWDEIYRTIFKLDSTIKIPSPYCETITSRIDVTTAEKTIGLGSLADFEIYLRRLADDGSEQDTSAINNCLDLVQRFQRGITSEQPGLTIDTPPLTFDYPDDGTGTYGSESQGFPSSTVADSITIPNAEELNDLSYEDSSFKAHFDNIFPFGEPSNFLDSLDLGGNSGLLPGG
ncbi:hypothetical protein F4805DRAFT_463366 [Annulohypoxylon moriforme]|nr:hypothetical protein F4805DRAFT_463366 [Annulohypoxylon moriforme]